MDSNQRTLSGQIYSLVDLTTLPPLHRAERHPEEGKRAALFTPMAAGRQRENGVYSPGAGASQPLPQRNIKVSRRGQTRYAGTMAEHKRKTGAAKPGAAPARLWLYGRHAVAAALKNPDRRVRRVLATKNAADWLNRSLGGDAPKKQPEDARPDAIDKLLPPGAVHQGLAAEVFDLPRTRLKEACAPAEVGRPVLVLDQITDPQNIGAIFRAAAAFEARAVIVQERRTPPLAGALAKAAAGAVETVPCVKVVNIARSLEALSDLGYLTAGLTGGAATDIADLDKSRPIALVMGAEGSGLRELVAATCQEQTRIPIAAAMESLNVATAAAISLYECARVSPKPE